MRKQDAERDRGEPCAPRGRNGSEAAIGPGTQGRRGARRRCPRKPLEGADRQHLIPDTWTQGPRVDGTVVVSRLACGPVQWHPRSQLPPPNLGDPILPAPGSAGTCSWVCRMVRHRRFQAFHPGPVTSPELDSSLFSPHLGVRSLVSSPELRSLHQPQEDRALQGRGGELPSVCAPRGPGQGALETTRPHTTRPGLLDRGCLSSHIGYDLRQSRVQILRLLR